jgi:deoxyribodipyrimidine photo-lyase
VIHDFKDFKKNPPKGLIWFYRDLRVSDHAGLELIQNSGGNWVAIVLAPQHPDSAAGHFEQECQSDLEQSLRKLQIPLLRILSVEAKSLIEAAVRANPDLLLLTSRRYNSRDQGTLNTCCESLPSSQIKIYDHGTLYLESDLPFSLADLPSTFTPFQKKIRAKNTGFRSPLPEFSRISDISLTPNLPETTASLEMQGRTFRFPGGERSAILRMQEYFWKSRAALHYHETRNGLLARDDSSKLSPYLAQGCISPREVFTEMLKLKEKEGPSKGLDALLYELEWRDYFKFLALRSGAQLFQAQGLRQEERETTPDREIFRRWCAGQTGNDFIDANMRELKETGWMSNRGRQNVASFMAKILKLPWLWGAEWFEKNLIDFDVETNQGNWMYLAGVGTDPRDRVFNSDLQATMYDPDGVYRARWLS